MSNIERSYQIISNIIEPKSRVLDIGCGNGSLLNFLIAHNNITGTGIEIEEKLANEAIASGINVIHGDADVELKYYPSNKYDYALINNSLQMMKDPYSLLHELLRISSKVIVNIPNFAYWKSRFYLFFKGEMPVTNSLDYQWYETPNIHFCTIKDFEKLLIELGYKINNYHYFVKKEETNDFKVRLMPNLFVEFALFTLERGITVDENDQNLSKYKKSIDGNILAKKSENCTN